MGNYCLRIYKKPTQEEYGKVLNIQVSKGTPNGEEEQIAGFNIRDIDQRNPFTIGSDSKCLLRIFDD